jgi:hypothetical protein
MKRHCQFTVKRSEKRVDLTVAAEQQPSGVQVMEWVGLIRAITSQQLSRLVGFKPVLNLAAEVNWTISLQLSTLYPSCRLVCGGGRRFHLKQL